MSDQYQQNTWVYGIVPAGATLDEFKRRSDRLPANVRVVELGDLGAIAGDAPREGDPKAIRDQALAHARVLEAAILDAPVVPFRFGTVVDDDCAVATELLEARHDVLGQLLESVKDYVQMTLKADYRQDVVLREITESNPMIARLREQIRGRAEIETLDLRVRLGELVNGALEQLREYDAGELVERLTPFSVGSTAGPLESEFMALNAPFLVERRRTPDFEQAAELLAEEQAGRMRLRLLGPMPAYDFVGGGQPAWA